ncbi:MAG TPA: ABC transporter permease subunit [Anaerolineae bacterium]|nr:ABC transporter permease subunit [Anaerolineae bacterium]
MTILSNTQASEKIPLWRDERILRIVAQIVSAVVVLAFLFWGVTNFLRITQQRGMPLTYNFLREPAGFPISEGFLTYDPTMSFGRAFLVGLINTLVVSGSGIVLASILGLIIGLARLSSNWLLSRIALAYIEFHRNIPLLVLMFLWYFGVFAKLPSVKESIAMPGPSYLSQRGLYITFPRLTETGSIFLIFSGIGVILAFAAFYILRHIRENTGRETHFGLTSLGLFLLLTIAGWFLSGGEPFWMDKPSMQGFNFQGGFRLSPEFTALLVSLTMYTAAFIAEVVRSGIQAVHRGQVEAARALGLRSPQVMSLIVLPQALRVIIPPLISQYLNLTKNSSLALTIGFQELFAISKITINQAGRAVPVFLMVMLTYLAISLLTSLVLNVYNRKVQFVER